MEVVPSVREKQWKIQKPLNSKESDTFLFYFAALWLTILTEWHCNCDVTDKSFLHEDIYLRIFHQIYFKKSLTINADISTPRGWIYFNQQESGAVRKYRLSPRLAPPKARNAVYLYSRLFYCAARLRCYCSPRISVIPIFYVEIFYLFQNAILLGALSLSLLPFPSFKFISFTRSVFLTVPFIGSLVFNFLALCLFTTNLKIQNPNVEWSVIHYLAFVSLLHFSPITKRFNYPSFNQFFYYCKKIKIYKLFAFTLRVLVFYLFHITT